MNYIETILITPWPWWVSGLMITFTMYLLLFFGKSFGMSGNLRTMCSIGASKFSDFFKFDWKKEIWNLVVAGGAMLGGFTFANYLLPHQTINISDATISDLNELNIHVEKGQVPVLPEEIFSWENLFTLQGFIIIVIGGFLVGFGTRYAGGCTSGHAISGLSNLQLPSLYAVLGFFTGGLIMVHFLLPYILQL
ncbi:MAG: YeeE/YedE family protein [Flavobacteriales bacterium]|jgi:uncharacterized membrane protein YedE/YeeE|nr:YeeE/YedE family protein [Flavobacteriales bacterium]